MPFMAEIGFSTIFGSHTDKLSKLFVSPVRFRAPS
nr:MAG TPA: hypothetical protein [Caudoviricetes sp.]